MTPLLTPQPLPLYLVLLTMHFPVQSRLYLGPMINARDVL